MKKAGFVAGALAALVVFATTLAAPAPRTGDETSLARFVPNDVFLFINDKNNPARDFIERYWAGVAESLAETGIEQDLIDLAGTFIGLAGGGGTEELVRLKERAVQLVGAVDWEALGGEETVFAERFVPPARISEESPPFLMPEMVFIFRGTPEGAAANHEKLAAILDAIAEEANGAVGSELLAVNRGTRAGASIAAIDLTAPFAGAPSIPITVAHRDDLVVIGVRAGLCDDVLALVDGSSGKETVASDERFQAGLAKLPPAEDSLTFFDMRALVKSLRDTADVILQAVAGPKNVYLHSSMGAEINGLAGEAMAAYQSGDYEKALALTRQAHEISPDNSVILYNQACFNARAGNRGEALGWLTKAVEAGFYAPQQIAADSDLDSLHGEPAYEQALARAAELSLRHTAPDTVVNASDAPEVASLRMQIQQADEQKDHEQGMKLAKQAYAIAPEDPRVLYCLGYLHALLGNGETGLDFLEQAVEAGYYCPNHIARDPDWASVRGTERFEAALAAAREKASAKAYQQAKGWMTVADRIIDRIADNLAFLDYSLGVTATEGYTTVSETIAVLTPGAQDLPIYSVFGKRSPLADFDRYLPEETVSFSVSQGIDLLALYEFIEDTVRLAGPAGSEVVAKWKEIQDQIGVDVREDVIGWIDGDAISMTLDSGATVTLIKVTDEEKARQKIAAAIEFSTTKLGELVRQNPAMAALNMVRMTSRPLKDERLEGFQALRIAVSPQPIIWGVAGGFVVIGSSADAVALSMATARGEHPSVRSNERVMSEAIVPEGGFASVSLTDLRGLGQQLEQGFGIGAMVTGMMGAFIPEPEVQPIVGKISAMLGKVGMVAGEINFYKSMASCTTFDGEAWRTRAATHYFAPEEREQTEAGDK